MAIPAMILPALASGGGEDSAVVAVAAAFGVEDLALTEPTVEGGDRPAAEIGRVE
jgi:hypothetical protein